MKTLFNTPEAEIVLYHPHETPDENPRVKYHMTSTGEDSLCGYSDGAYGASIGDAEVTIDYLSQADPDNWFCKKCRDKSMKILQARKNTRKYNHYEAKREVTRRLNLLQKKEDSMFETNGFGFEMHDYYEMIMKNLNTLNGDIGSLEKNNDWCRTKNTVHPSSTKLNSLEYGSELEVNL